MFDLYQCKNGCENTENWCIEGRRRSEKGGKGKNKMPNVCAKIEKKLKTKGLSALGFDVPTIKDPARCPTLCTKDSECEKNKECVSYQLVQLFYQFLNSY